MTTFAACGTGVGTGSTTCPIVLTANVPQVSPTNGQTVVIFFQTWSNSFPGVFVTSITDDGTTPGTGYSGTINQLIPGGPGAGGGTGLTFTYSMGAFIYGVFNPLSIGDTITIGLSATVDYFRASAFTADGLIDGACTSFEFGGSGPANGFGPGTTTQSTPFTVSGPQDFAMYILGEVATPGVGALSWLDSGVVLLDSWYDDGPSSDSSFICGYQGGISTGTWDVGGSTDVTPDNSNSNRVGAVGYAGSFFLSDVGVDYCTTPAAGTPCFNNRTRLSV